MGESTRANISHLFCANGVTGFLLFGPILVVWQFSCAATVAETLSLFGADKAIRIALPLLRVKVGGHCYNASGARDMTNK